MRKRSLDSGLRQKDQWWELIESAGDPERNTRTPTVEEIVRTLILVEEYLDKPLPGRTDGKHGVRPNVFAALWWLVLTAQRTYAGLHIRQVGYFPDEERAESGWHLAHWLGSYTKSGKTHVLPIPPRVVAFMAPLLSAVRNAHDTEWLFPSERGDDEDDITVGRSGVRQCLQRFAANDPLSKDEKGQRREGFVDFFEQLGIPWWTPHDVRRTIGVELDKVGLPGGHSAILAHKIEALKESKTDKRRAHWLEHYTQDVTRKAYHDPLMMSLKSKAMLAWTDRVLDVYLDLKGITSDFVEERRAGLILNYVASDLHHLQDAVRFAKMRYEEEVLHARKTVEGEQADLHTIKSLVRNAAEITEELETKLRMSSLALKHSTAALRMMEERKVDHILEIVDRHVEDTGTKFDGVALNIKLKQIHLHVGREFTDIDRFYVEKDLPVYQNLRRKFAGGEITFDELQADTARLYDLQIAKPRVDQAAIRKQLAEEFGIDFPE